MLRMYSTTNEELLSIIENKVIEFGEFSNAVLVTKITILQNLIKFCSDNPLITELIDEIKLHYHGSLPEHVKVRKVYSKELYTAINHKRMNIDESISNMIVHVQDYSTLESLENIKWYIYIIDEFDNFKLCRFPITTSELIMKRTYIDGTQLIHPLLLDNPHSKVKTAGELSTIRFDDRLKGILINNRSGHFKPHNDSLSLVVKRLENLGIHSQEIYVTSMG